MPAVAWAASDVRMRPINGLSLGAAEHQVDRRDARDNQRFEEDHGADEQGDLLPEGLREHLNQVVGPRIELPEIVTESDYVELRPSGIEAGNSDESNDTEGARRQY